MKHISLTAFRVTPRGFVRGIVNDDGRTVLASAMPRSNRNGATVAAWTLANDMRAGRVDTWK